MPLRPPAVNIAFLLVALASLWLAMTLPVFSQEAYYWTYSLHPDLSYFDHPPMVAWLIWLGTRLLGDGAMGLRLGSWLCGMVTTWAGLQVLRDFGVDGRGQSLWILAAVASPVLLMAHFLANPDAPLVASWSVTLLALWRAREGRASGERAKWWIIAGVAAGCALLSKYTGVFLAVSGATLLLVDAKMRRQLAGPWPYLAVLTAACVFLPVLLWNASHDFASFRFQSEHRFADARLGTHWLFQLLITQFGLLHPLIALLTPFAILWLLRTWRGGDLRGLWLLAFTLPLPLYLMFTSLWIQVKANWLVPAYVPLTLAIVFWWRQSANVTWGPRVRRVAVASLLFVPMLLPLAPMIRLVPSSRGTSWSGWPEIAACADKWEDLVDVEDGVEGNMFFFAADYRDAAQLTRGLHQFEAAEEGGAAAPEEPILAQNVFGTPALQFDFWEQPGARIGQHAVFVLTRPKGREEMVEQARARFASVELVESLPIRCVGVHVFDADLYLCRNYAGPRPH